MEKRNVENLDDVDQKPCKGVCNPSNGIFENDAEMPGSSKRIIRTNHEGEDEAFKEALKKVQLSVNELSSTNQPSHHFSESSCVGIDDDDDNIIENKDEKFSDEEEQSGDIIKPFFCGFCGKGFQFANNLIAHSQFHSNEGFYNQPQQGKSKFSPLKTVKFVWNF